MQYQVIVLDLDGTLTNSKKEITEPTRQALIDIQKNGKTVVLASGRPINGVAPLAKQLRLQDFGGYMLSFNGARVTRCSDGKIIYNKQIPPEMIRPICDIVRSYAEQGVDLITYTDTTIISAIAPNQYTRIESGINRMEIYQPDDFVSYIDFPINKLLVPGPADVLQELMKLLKEKYHGLLNIYLSEPYFLEIMPQNIDKAHSLQKLLNSIGRRLKFQLNIFFKRKLSFSVVNDSCGVPLIAVNQFSDYISFVNRTAVLYAAYKLRSNTAELVHSQFFFVTVCIAYKISRSIRHDTIKRNGFS